MGDKQPLLETERKATLEQHETSRETPGRRPSLKKRHPSMTYMVAPA